MDKKIKNILISQPAPADLEKSQYKVLMDKYDLNFTFNKFFNIVGVTNREYRNSKINILEHTAVIMTSKLSVDNYFRLAKELRCTIPESMKFFCVTENIANYLQNYIQYRKRKIFYGKLLFKDLIDVILKHKDEKFLYPCSEDTPMDNFLILNKAKIEYTKSVMYRSVAKDLTEEIDITKQDMVVMFSPIGVKSFVESFPEYNHDKIIFAAFGSSTQALLKEYKIKTVIPAPTTIAPSMVMAMDRYLSMDEEDMQEHLQEIETEFKKAPEKKTAAKTTRKKATTTSKATTTKKKTTTKTKAETK